MKELDCYIGQKDKYSITYNPRPVTQVGTLIITPVKTKTIYRRKTIIIEDV